MGEQSRRKRDSLTPAYCEYPGCEYTRIFQRHRIIPGRDGGKYKLGNVIALCPNHHAEADRGWISSEELLEIVQQRIQRGVEEENNIEHPEGSSPPEEAGRNASKESSTSGTDRAGNGIDGNDEGIPPEGRSG